MAGVVKRADVKEDKDGKSRGMGTVTFEQALEAVQAICILHSSFLFKIEKGKGIHSVPFYWDLFLDTELSHVQWTDALRQTDAC